MNGLLMTNNKVKFCDNGKEYDGNVLSVNREDEIITVCYNNGKQTMLSNMPFSHIIAVGN